MRFDLRLARTWAALGVEQMKEAWGTQGTSIFVRHGQFSTVLGFIFVCTVFARSAHTIGAGSMQRKALFIIGVECFVFSITTSVFVRQCLWIREFHGEEWREG